MCQDNISLSTDCTVNVTKQHSIQTLKNQITYTDRFQQRTVYRKLDVITAHDAVTDVVCCTACSLMLEWGCKQYSKQHCSNERVPHSAGHLYRSGLRTRCTYLLLGPASECLQTNSPVC